jgi:hypothetical protein
MPQMRAEVLESRLETSPHHKQTPHMAAVNCVANTGKLFVHIHATSDVAGS